MYGADHVNKCQSYVFVDMRVGTVGVAADHNKLQRAAGGNKLEIMFLN
jgi:hypothetical protein